VYLLHQLETVHYRHPNITQNNINSSQLNFFQSVQAVLRAGSDPDGEPGPYSFNSA